MFGDLFVCHEVGGSIKTQEIAVFSNVGLFAKWRQADMTEWGAFQQCGWASPHGCAGGAGIKDRWVS